MMIYGIVVVFVVAVVVFPFHTRIRLCWKVKLIMFLFSTMLKANIVIFLLPKNVWKTKTKKTQHINYKPFATNKVKRQRICFFMIISTIAVWLTVVVPMPMLGIALAHRLYVHFFAWLCFSLFFSMITMIRSMAEIMITMVKAQFC